MRERLKALAKEKDSAKLLQGLQRFHDENEDALYLIAKDGTDFYTDIENTLKAMRKEPPNIDEAHRQLTKAIKCLEDADKIIHHMTHHKYKVT